jgi:hypothetical protein
MPDIINAGSWMEFTEGDTAFDIEIDEPNWDCTGATAVFVLEDYTSHLPIPPFSGQAAIISHAKTPAKPTCVWPSALPAGRYRAYFVVTFADAHIASTGAVAILVEDA